jgi:hypothetical protein
MDHRTIEGDATYYTCDFYLLAYDEQAPWRCGLANSRVILALKLAHEHTQDQKYLDAAQSSLYSFTIPVTEGGLTKKLSDDSWWYCEYPKRNNESPMVLNGMLSILIAMHKYHVYSEDPLAKELFDKGIVALKSKLPEFDNNGNSYYDLRKKPASKDYHKIHISLLNQLYEILPDEMFKSYSDKWQAYANENGF